jgi:hypothetical protein
MEVGAIGFHDNSKVKSIRIEKNNGIVKELNKTKTTEFPDLQEVQEQRAAEYRAEIKSERKAQQQIVKAQKREHQEAAHMRSFA